jgi:hypothetical protein
MAVDIRGLRQLILNSTIGKDPEPFPFKNLNNNYGTRSHLFLPIIGT